MALGAFVLYVLQRVEPFPRFWLFMLPLFQLLVAAGIALALGRLIRRLGWRPSIRRAIVAAVAVLLCATISIAVLRSEIVLTASETGRVGDSVVIAATLAHDARPGDHFILSWKHGGLVPYYWRLWGLPNRAAPFGASTAKRLFVLDTTNQPVTEVVKSYEFHTGERDLLAGRHAVLKHRFSSGSLYELVKE
jgi:branched-subunit amino acid ABC-type transport system permease component